jgi:hypothetical protein
MEFDERIRNEEKAGRDDRGRVTRPADDNRITGHIVNDEQNNRSDHVHLVPQPN